MTLIPPGFPRSPHEFFEHCSFERTIPLLPFETCARCGITYAAYFEDPERVSGHLQGDCGSCPR